jgi:hypothetical protein
VAAGWNPTAGRAQNIFLIGPAGEVGPAKLGHPVEFAVRRAKKRTAKLFFCRAFPKSARQRFFHKI